jgi:hypothetical protein
VTTTSARDETAPAIENACVPAASFTADCEALELGVVIMKRKPGGKRRNKLVKWMKEEHK